MIDEVGYGLNSYYEGSGPAPLSTDVNLSITRNNQDTNNNNLDFILSTPTPQNSINSNLGLSSNINKSKYSLIRNSIVSNQIFFENKSKVEILDSQGKIVKVAQVFENYFLDVSELPDGIYIVKGTVKDKLLISKIIKKHDN